MAAIVKLKAVLTVSVIYQAMVGVGVRIGALDSLGHMRVSGTLGFSRGEWPRQRLEFAFEFDPSQLITVLSRCEGGATEHA